MKFAVQYGVVKSLKGEEILKNQFLKIFGVHIVWNTRNRFFCRIEKNFCHFFKLNARIQNLVSEIFYDKPVPRYVTRTLNLVHL